MKANKTIAPASTKPKKRDQTPIPAWTFPRGKFSRLARAAKRFSKIREALEADAKKGLQPALCGLLILETGMRPSRDEVRSTNLAFGATNLTRAHVVLTPKVDQKFRETRFLTAPIGGKPHPTAPMPTFANFQFRGKKGVLQTFSTANKVLTDYLAERLKTDKVEVFDVNEDQLNRYLKKVSGGFTAKDFRTILANQVAAKVVQHNRGNPLGKVRSLVAKEVSAFLQNTPAVALESYVDPEVFKVKVKPAPSARVEKVRSLPPPAVRQKNDKQPKRQTQTSEKVANLPAVAVSVIDSIGPAKCKANDDHLVELGEAYACCRKQLLSVQQMTTRFVDLFQGMVDLAASGGFWTNKARSELLNLFDEFPIGDPEVIKAAFAPGPVGRFGAPAPMTLPKVIPGSAGGLGVVMVRGGVGVPAGTIVPWTLPGWSADTEVFEEAMEKPVEAVLMQTEFWAHPEVMLQTATAVLHAIDRSVRRRVQAENCCACLRTKILSHAAPKKKRVGTVWTRRKGGRGTEEATDPDPEPR